MKTKRVWRLGCVFFGLLLFVIASQASAEKVMKVGTCEPYAGPAGLWGKLMTDGVRAVAEEFNSRGGLNIGGEKYKIVIIEADSKFTPEGALAAGRRLVEVEKVDWIVGALAEFTSMALQEVSEPAKVITLNTGSGSEVIDKKRGKSKYSFRSYIQVHEQIPAIMKWVSRKYPNARIAMLDPTISGPMEGQKLVKKFAPTVGLKVVYSELYEPTTNDFYPFLVKLVTTKPDVIFTGSAAPQQLALMIKGSRELGYKGIFIGAQPPDIEHMIPICGSEMIEGILSMSYAFSGPMLHEKTKKWIDVFSKKYGSPYTGIINAPAASAIFQAYEEAGTLDSDKVVSVLESGKTWDTVLGIKGKFGAAEVYGHPHQWLCTQYILEVKNGKNVPISEIPIADMLYKWNE